MIRRFSTKVLSTDLRIKINEFKSLEQQSTEYLLKKSVYSNDRKLLFKLIENNLLYEDIIKNVLICVFKDNDYRNIEFMLKNIMDIQQNPDIYLEYIENEENKLKNELKNMNDNFMILEQSL